MASRSSTESHRVPCHEHAALAPPSSIVDDDDRRIRYRTADPEDRSSLVAMYEDFAAADRTQGLPPVERSGIEAWLDVVLDDASVLAVHDGRIVGHVMFVADDAGEHELGVFVHQYYQDAGVGTNLLRAGLAHAGRRGITDVWLSVAPRNRRARAVYERLEFVEDGECDHGIRLSTTL
ncbi:GNAT family N-acetyltransferase [Halorubellus sp. JP-L1]|uniref:GNAT family N-acetyltransferase n=1 Tax=Halorubellus sp. JP-L1 TaxID=2715753 RepID=UPI00140955D0|nr:GNAT family N-acetyltransferase [Halorubellus sp. JP-L1]NHN42122.1 GNAT family N-acetyltransferase [Halorubellus sp. JP-L1]